MRSYQLFNGTDIHMDNAIGVVSIIDRDMLISIIEENQALIAPNFLVSEDGRWKLDSFSLVPKGSIKDGKGKESAEE